MTVNIDVMRERLDQIENTELRSIHDEAGEARFSEDQQKRWDALDSEAAEIRQNIAKAEADEKREDERAERRARWGSVQVAPTRQADPFDLNEMRVLRGDELVDRAKSAFDSTYSRKAPEAVAEVLRKLEVHSDSDDLARYAMINGSLAYRSAFGSVMAAVAQGRAPILTQAEADAMRASMALGTGTGGYALPTILDPTLIKTGAMTKNPIRKIARVEQGTQNKWHGVTVGNVTTAWKGEGSAFTDGSPADGGVEIDAAMLTAYVTGSFEIFQDSSWMSQLPGLIGEAVDMEEGVAFVSGSGSDAPLGIVTAISATVGSTVTATTRGTFNTTSAVDTLALFNSLPARYEDSSTWLMNKSTYLTIAQQVVGTAGTKIVDMTNRNVILDLPVERASSITATTTSGNILAVLGDFSQYVIYDRLGLNVEIIQNVVDGSGIPLGKRGLVAYKRVGAKPSDVNAFRFLKA